MAAQTQLCLLGLWAPSELNRLPFIGSPINPLGLPEVQSAWMPSVAASPRPTMDQQRYKNVREAGLKPVSGGLAHASLFTFLHGIVVPTPDLLEGLLEGSWEDPGW